jgi:hypothetical protein
MRPLVEDLKLLCEGVGVYNCYNKQKVILRVVYLWPIHHFLAYDIFSGWRCHGILTYLICVEDTCCFRVKFGGKISYFDCHRCFFLRITCLGSREMLSERAQL